MYKKTSAAYKKFNNEVGKGYISGMESWLIQAIEYPFKTEDERKLNVDHFYNEYLKNVTRYNELSGEHINPKSMEELTK